MREITGDWQIADRNFREGDICKALSQAGMDLIATPVPTALALSIKRRIARKRHYDLDDEQLVADEAWLAANRGSGRHKRQVAADTVEAVEAAVEPVPMATNEQQTVVEPSPPRSSSPWAVALSLERQEVEI